MLDTERNPRAVFFVFSFCLFFLLLCSANANSLQEITGRGSLKALGGVVDSAWPI